MVPGRQGKNRITVTRQMRGRDGAGQSIVRHLSHFGRLDFLEARICGRDAQGGVLSGLAAGRRARSQKLSRVGQAHAVRRSDAGDHLPGRRIDDVADGVHRDQCRNDESTRQAD